MHIFTGKSNCSSVLYILLLFVSINSLIGQKIEVFDDIEIYRKIRSEKAGFLLRGGKLYDFQTNDSLCIDLTDSLERTVYVRFESKPDTLKEPAGILFSVEQHDLTIGYYVKSTKSQTIALLREFAGYYKDIDNHFYNREESDYGDEGKRLTFERSFWETEERIVRGLLPRNDRSPHFKISYKLEFIVLEDGVFRMLIHDFDVINFTMDAEAYFAENDRMKYRAQLFEHLHQDVQNLRTVFNEYLEGHLDYLGLYKKRKNTFPAMKNAIFNR
jgi:hypothetical protein